MICFCNKKDDPRTSCNQHSVKWKNDKQENNDTITTTNTASSFMVGTVKI